MTSLTETLARRAVERSVVDRQAAYVEEMNRIVEATYALIERTGTVDPPLRDILKQTGLSTQAFYRYFQSKDELMLLVLDDGRRRLVGYLEHRMARAEAAETAGCVSGSRACSRRRARPTAASRTRPFMTNQDRLAEAYPEDHQASVDALVQQIDDVLGDRRAAEAIYLLAMAALHRHLIRGTIPGAGEIDDLVRFSLGGAAALSPA